jgi:hypothetical protein
MMSERTVTTVSSDVFDRLLQALDEAEAAPALERAAERARRRPRIR